MTPRDEPMNNTPKDDLWGICMAGSISQLPNGKFYVSWYDKKLRKNWKIYKYKGLPLYNREMAEKLLHAMQNDVENGCFRLERYTIGETDVVPYLHTWLDAIETTISPATYKDYHNSIENHLAPFYKTHPISLHEIQYDNLVQLLTSISREGKGKLNTMMCLHRCLRYAKKSGRIQAMPEFPERSVYQIVEPVIQWLPSERQEAVIRAIPVEHQPIFWWLKYHLRRPSEACALRKDDYEAGKVFLVRRGFSAKVSVDRTKTGEIHTVPCVSDFLPYIAVEENKQREAGIVSPFFFVNPSGRKFGKHYTLVMLEKTWDKAAGSVGETINLYAGLKHSTASQMVNEWGYSESEVQMAGDWARKESVKKYAKTEVSARRNLLEGKKVVLGSFRQPLKSEDTEIKG